MHRKLYHIYQIPSTVRHCASLNENCCYSFSLSKWNVFIRLKQTKKAKQIKQNKQKNVEHSTKCTKCTKCTNVRVIVLFLFFLNSKYLPTFEIIFGIETQRNYIIECRMWEKEGLWRRITAVVQVDFPVLQWCTSNSVFSSRINGKFFAKLMNSNSK